MNSRHPHLFVDISSHGFGHLAQTAPVLNELHRRRPNIRITIRSGLPEKHLQTRIGAPFLYRAGSSDFGFTMQDAMRIDPAATLAKYQAEHANWPRRVIEEANFLKASSADFVLSNVSYLPLAGAREAGIPAAAMCSLNWGDLFAHYFLKPDAQEWVQRTYLQISGAYAAQTFLALEPAMPMPTLPQVIRLPPVATAGHRQREHLQALTGKLHARFVLVAFGGIPVDLPVERWPRHEDIVWLVPGAWEAALKHPACFPIERLGLDFSDLLASVDAIVTKPGYGTFVEAATYGTKVLYLRRDDWPEQHCLIDWLQRHASARELSPENLAANLVEHEMEALWTLPVPPRPPAEGAGRVVDWLLERL